MADWPGDLKKGSRGKRVEQMTARLAYLGFPIQGVSPHTGAKGFGAKVEAAVKDFQSHYRLKVDGIVGPKTDKVLREKVAAKKRRRAKAALAAQPDTTAKKVSEKLLDFVQEFEGGQAPDGLFHPYWDDIGSVWTIGYGHTENVSRNSRPLTKKQAEDLLRDDFAAIYVPPILKLKLGLRQNQLDAVASAVYNIGPGILERDRSLGAALRSKDPNQVATAIRLYNKGGDPPKVVDGLRRRRDAEALMYLKGIYDTTP